MKIVVTAGSGDSVPTSSWLSQLNTQLQNNFLTGNQPGLLYNNNGNPAVPGPVPYTGPINRSLTLNEDFDEFGRLIQTLGTTVRTRYGEFQESFWPCDHIDMIGHNLDTADLGGFRFDHFAAFDAIISQL